MVELMNLSVSGAGAATVSAAATFSGSACTSGCATIRADNLNFTVCTWETPLTGGLVMVDNVFGIVDHNTGSKTPSGGSPSLVLVNYSSWPGVGNSGDNSFSAADTLGTSQTMFIENNSLTGVRGSENDVSPEGVHLHSRCPLWMQIECHLQFTGVCSGHGTAWISRPRGRRQVEVYYNTVSCTWTDGNSCGAGNGLKRYRRFDSTLSSLQDPAVSTRGDTWAGYRYTALPASCSQGQ